FFSSRRRHTRFSRDWSSDVCSSDLDPRAEFVYFNSEYSCMMINTPFYQNEVRRLDMRTGQLSQGGGGGWCWPSAGSVILSIFSEIGRASCRERGKYTMNAKDESNSR